MKSSSQRKIGIILNYLTLIFNICIGFVYTPFMISCLGDSQYGIYSISNSLISLITLLDLGFGQTLGRYITEARVTGDKEKEHKLNGLFLKLYSIIAFIALIIGIFLLYLYPQLTQNTFTNEESGLFRIAFSILLINIVVSFPMNVFSSTISAYEEFFFYKLANFIMLIVKYSLMILLLIIGYKLVAITIITVACSLALKISYMIYAIKKLNIKFDFTGVDISLTKEIYWFSFFIFINLIIDFLYSNTDKLILGAVSGTLAVSIYSIGVYFSTYFEELSTAMSGVFMPKIMEYYTQNNRIEISNTFLKISRLQMALLFLILGGYIGLGQEFLNIWVGSRYKDSYYIVLLIMIPLLVPLTQTIGLTVLRAMNLHKYRSLMYLVIAILNVTLSIPLAINYGGIGSAIGTCIGTILGHGLFMNWFYAKRIYLNIHDYWISFYKFTMMTTIPIAIIYLIKNIIIIRTWSIFFLFVILFTIIYIVLYWFFISNEYEKELVLNSFKNIKFK